MRYSIFAALLACLCFPDLATAALSWQRETDFDQMLFQDGRAGKERLVLKAYGPLMEPGTILTVAGTGAGGFSGDDGPAIEASLNSPSGLAVDDLTGNLFIADALNHRVRMVDPQGIITTVAGMGEGGSFGDGIPAIEANLYFPRGIAVDPAFGELFIADLGHQRIRKVDLSGLITTVAGAGGEGFSGDGGPATKARISVVQGIAVDGFAGNLFIADLLNHRVRMVDYKGIITTVAGTGERGFSGDDGLATEAQLNAPVGLAVNAEGNLLIADSRNHRVRMVDSQGIITTVAGTGTGGFSGDDGPATEARLNGPTGLAVDGVGKLFIADSGNRRVRVVDSQGIITTVAGTGKRGFSGDGGPATEAQFDTPTGVAVDAKGNLFISDESGHRVRMVVDAAASISPEVTAVEELDQTLPQQTALHSNFPNPFNAQTTIDYQLAAPAAVQLSIYNLGGQAVKHLVQGNQQAGFYRVSWDGTDDAGKPVSSGVYFYNLSAGEYQQTRRLVVVK